MTSFMDLLKSPSFTVHYWGAFCTVVLLGVIQILLAYYNSHITIEALPDAVSATKRRRYRSIFRILVLGITLLTLLLARLNDANQFDAALLLEQERTKQEGLRSRLDETFRAINDSQAQLNATRSAVESHPATDPGRTLMLRSIDEVQTKLMGHQPDKPGSAVEQQRRTVRPD